MSVVRTKNVAKIQTNYAKQQELVDISSTNKRKLVVRRLALFTLFAAVFSYFMISTILTQSSALEEKKTEKRQLDQDLAALKKKQDIYEEEIIKLNDDEYIAKLARREYFLSEKNEIIFNLPDDKKKEKTSN